jgi:hypothetical protein
MRPLCNNFAGTFSRFDSHFCFVTQTNDSDVLTPKMIRGRKKPSKTGRIIFGFVVLLVIYFIWTNVDFATNSTTDSKLRPLSLRRAFTQTVNMLIGTAESGERQGVLERVVMNPIVSAHSKATFRAKGKCGLVPACRLAW